jgi:hypothetical protein
MMYLRWLLPTASTKASATCGNDRKALFTQFDFTLFGHSFGTEFENSSVQPVT